jgi:hypothetical protein
MKGILIITIVLEGAAGVNVMPERGSYYAVTSASGGYAIPATADGTYLVTFFGGPLPYPFQRPVTLAEQSVLFDVIIGVDLVTERGDVNGDTTLNLKDIILALQISAGQEVSMSLQLDSDVNQDGRIGVPEALFGLQKLSVGAGLY